MNLHIESRFCAVLISLTNIFQTCFHSVAFIAALSKISKCGRVKQNICKAYTALFIIYMLRMTQWKLQNRLVQITSILFMSQLKHHHLFLIGHNWTNWNSMSITPSSCNRSAVFGSRVQMCLCVSWGTNVQLSLYGSPIKWMLHMEITHGAAAVKSQLNSFHSYHLQYKASLFVFTTPCSSFCLLVYSGTRALIHWLVLSN